MQPAPLFSEPETDNFRSQWTNIQSDFVDEPRRAVENADRLVASLMKKLAEVFAQERERLEKQWDRGGWRRIAGTARRILNATRLA